MNYEEMLAQKSDGRLYKSKQPIGLYYREQVDGKYRGLVDIDADKHDSIVFSEALKAECEKNKTLANSHQMHFSPVGDTQEIVRLELETGVFVPFEQLLAENPAIVAAEGFFEGILQGLVDITAYLHRQGIWHMCYSPRTVFARKGDNAVMLLSHGSFYQEMDDLAGFYGDDAAYVAPEVLAHGAVDGRCDVYSIGKFMETLFQSTGMPLTFKKAVRKATSEAPEDRYECPADFLKAVQTRKSLVRTSLTLLAALVLGMIGVGLYFDLFPEVQPVEFVKSAPRQATDDLLDDGFDPEELGVVSADSLVGDEQVSQRDYEAKAEEIFRKKYEAEADRILSKIYNKEYMSNSEKKFTTESQSTIDELMRAQSEIATDAGLAETRAQLIASEIIDRITEQKKKSMGGTNSRAIQK